MDRSRLFETLKERGYVYQTTNEAEVKKLLNGDPITCYVGIDPTADCLHIGHCFPLIIAKYLQEAGHHVIVLLGGATAKIGDPTGKTDMRKMVDDDFINANYQGIVQCIGKFLDLVGENKALVLNNASWFQNLGYVDFMREIGVHFNVNKMLASEAYSRRLEQGGLTFFEMGYMLMQAYDFVHLNKEYGCRLEFGGSDQWGNILAGADLGRKLAIAQGKDAETFQAFTNPLLTNYEGVKMGKTEKGALWVEKEKTSPYEFYQYFYNVDDKDVENFLKVLTRIPLDEITSLMAGDIRIAKQRMAYEITKLIHGKEEADKAVEASKSLFGGGVDMSNVPTFRFPNDGSISTLADLLVATKLVSSKSEARRMCEQGGVSLNGEVTKDWAMPITKALFKDNALLLKKGKKSFVNVVLA